MTDIRPTRWTRRDLDRLAEEPATTAPVIDPATTPRVLPDHDIWDLWPVQREDGTTATVPEGELWMTPSPPAVGHPEHRHDSRASTCWPGPATAGRTSGTPSPTRVPRQPRVVGVRPPATRRHGVRLLRHHRRTRRGSRVLTVYVSLRDPALGTAIAVGVGVVGIVYAIVRDEQK
ncbi:hypothetical protein E1265_24980 [Streptomyces sp. 8K308]|uniref:hypothetical protein n=1 Tax=Streptomyces sp. 8K308 TaxID=2530388 RepID=UPI001046EC8F|nr:hypothetical protein [Streptomyces sp. 8K308]TDC18638.1 hypothetical protein E1265_24980 [Streptomyces sp. 8K308]